MSWESISEVDVPVPLENCDEVVDVVSPLKTEPCAGKAEVSVVNLERELMVDILSRSPLPSLERVVPPEVRARSIDVPPAIRPTSVEPISENPDACNPGIPSDDLTPEREEVKEL